jgi:hypothetical protein
MLVQQAWRGQNTAMPLTAPHAALRSRAPCQLWAAAHNRSAAKGNAMYGQAMVSKIDDAGNSMRQQMPCRAKLRSTLPPNS